MTAPSRMKKWRALLAPVALNVLRYLDASEPDRETGWTVDRSTGWYVEPLDELAGASHVAPSAIVPALRELVHFRLIGLEWVNGREVRVTYPYPRSGE